MKVKIKDLEYEIVEENDGEKVFKDKDNQMRLGLTEYRQQKIYLLKEMTVARKKRVLIHELTHAFIEAYGMIGEFNDEQVCEFMATHSREINAICDKYFDR